MCKTLQFFRSYQLTPVSDPFTGSRRSKLFSCIFCLFHSVDIYPDDAKAIVDQTTGTIVNH